MSINLSSFFSVFRQFVSPEAVYLELKLSGKIPLILISVVIIAFIWGFVPQLFINWDNLENEWISTRRPQLVSDGLTVSEADSTIISELESLRWQRDNLPYIHILTRAFYALLGGAAVYLLGRALNWKLSFSLNIAAAVLCQGAYLITGILSTVFSLILQLAPGLSLSPALLFHTPSASATRITVFLYYFLSHLDLSSVISLTIWGIGLGALSQTGRASGVRAAFSVYLAGILLISMPLMLPSAG